MASGLSPYSEEDDPATELAVIPLREQRWIVQITPLDRPLMSTEQLIAELRRGWQIHWRTLVWRSGMDDWLPIAAIEILAREAGEPPSARQSRELPPHPRAFGASCLAAVLAMALSLDALRRGGAFDAGGGPSAVLTEHRAALTAGPEH